MSKLMMKTAVMAGRFFHTRFFDNGKQSIGRTTAISLFKSKWWIGRDCLDIALRQLFTAELACPFEVFHEAVEKALGRGVWTHEFALNYDGICREIVGKQKPPTMQEIVEMVPVEKRIVVLI